MSGTVRDENAVFAHPGVDGPTLGLLAALWGVLLGNLAWAWQGFDSSPIGTASWWLHAGAHVMLGVLGLNATFTVWHEAAHGLVFRARWANDVVGLLGAFPALLPYFGIRRVHQLHHAHTNDPERDPDAWFLDGSIWSLPLRYPAGARRAARLLAALRPPAWERWADRLLLLTAAALMSWMLVRGAAAALLACWIVPKLIAMWIHAAYVNWLPHRGLPIGRFRDTRVFDRPWLQPLVLCHNYHGLHHAWQTVPWHRYRRAFEVKRASLLERGTPVSPPRRTP